MKMEQVQTSKMSRDDAGKLLEIIEGSGYVAIGDSDIFIVEGFGYDHPEEWAKVVYAVPFLKDANVGINIHLHL